MCQQFSLLHSLWLVKQITWHTALKPESVEFKILPLSFNWNLHKPKHIDQFILEKGVLAQTKKKGGSTMQIFSKAIK